MTLNDPLANMMSALNNAEMRGITEIKVRPCSKILLNVLKIMQDNHYIGEFKEVETQSGRYVSVVLINRINKCGVIKPRFSVRADEFEKFEKRYLLAKGFGIIIVSTNKGITTHIDAKQKSLGGKLLAYCY